MLKTQNEMAKTEEEKLTAKDVGLHEYSTPSLKALYNQNYKACADEDLSHHAEQLTLAAAPLYELFNVKYPNSLNDEEFINHLSATEDLSSYLLAVFRTVNAHQQADSLELDPDAVSALAVIYEHVSNMPLAARPVLQGVFSALSMSRNFDYQVEGQFYNNNPMRYNGRGSKLFGLLQQKMGDASSLYLPKKTRYLKRAVKLREDIYSDYDQEIGQPAYKIWPLQAGIGVEIQDPRFRGALVESEEGSAPGPEEKYKPLARAQNPGPMKRLGIKSSNPARAQIASASQSMKQGFAAKQPFKLQMIRMKQLAKPHAKPRAPTHPPHHMPSKPFHLLQYRTSNPTDFQFLSSSNPDQALLNSKLQMLALLKQGMALDQKINDISSHCREQHEATYHA